MTRHPGGSDPAPVCALVVGAPVCRCPEDSPHLTEEQIVARAVSMLRWDQQATPDGKAAVRRGLDALLAHARDRGPSSFVAELLRTCLTLRILGAEAADAEDVEVLLQELIEIAEASGDPRSLGDAATLKAHRSTVFGHGENALVDAASAFAVLTGITGPGDEEDPVQWARYLSRSLNGLVLVLLKLGAHELADEVSRRAVAVSADSRSPMDQLVHQLNRVRLQLSWGLRLERGGRDAAAATRFIGAAQTAHTAARLWAPAMTTSGEGIRPAAMECAVIGAAYALQRPSPEHLHMLGEVERKAHFTEDRIVLAIATARCLATAGRAAEAVAAVSPLHEELPDDVPEAVLAIALHREYATMDRLARGSPADAPALRQYAVALEDELWALREARLTALRSHADHHELARRHGTATAQALQDPLTGLPNRRALELRLAEVAASATTQPCALALIDVDRFKDVNDARSHAAGDAVLREVAGCLSRTFRSRDLVARYGGDEFVVVMPATPLHVARAALVRAASSVAELPHDVAAGVTVSAGVVRAGPGGEPSDALSAADAAMYRAKHAGGNTVVSSSPEGNVVSRSGSDGATGPPRTSGRIGTVSP